MENKIYCGSGKEITFQTGGSLISITLDIETLQRFFKEHGFTTQQGKKKMKMNVSKRIETDQYGNTHSVSIDTWKPDPTQFPTKQQPSQQQQQQNQQQMPQQSGGFESYKPPTGPVNNNDGYTDEIPF